MAGPTGAVLLRDEPAKFWQLVRRRIVAADAEERPFAACSPLAQKLSGSTEVARLHSVPAREFSDWGDTGARLSVLQLGSGLPNLVEMAQQAWPFVRGSIALLMKPSLGAKEAVYPTTVSAPGVLQGLSLVGGTYRARRVNEHGWYVVVSNARETRAYRSRDMGRKWTPTSPWQTSLQGTSNRCLDDASDREFSVEATAGSGDMTINYFNQDAKTGQATVPRPLKTLRSLSCDGSSALLLTSDTPSQVDLWLCANDQTCRALPVPAQLKGLRFDGIDAARQKSATVVAVTQGALVRVLSSRDDGRSYTPFTVAIDHRDTDQPSINTYRPAQLLAIASTLLLVQEATTGPTGALALSSRDQGASWHGLN